MHSFGFDSELWVGTGVVDALHREGRSTVAIDCRGHGGSDKPNESERYRADRMALDIEELQPRLFDTDRIPVAPSHEEAMALLSQLRSGARPSRHSPRRVQPHQQDFASVTATVLLLAGTRDDDPTALL